MTPVQDDKRLAVLVATGPYRARAARSELDLALTAASLDFRVEVYFLGSALLQLATGRDPAMALLPAGYRGWAALPELGDAHFFADRAWLARCSDLAVELVAPVTGLGAQDMRQAWRECRYSVLL
ncbi:MAG: DsrE family protein [Xanthomonadales bacterium]|nr:DsrE family protein [Xanthomonadales bacterium]